MRGILTDVTVRRNRADPRTSTPAFPHQLPIDSPHPLCYPLAGFFLVSSVLLAWRRRSGPIGLIDHMNHRRTRLQLPVLPTAVFLALATFIACLGLGVAAPDTAWSGSKHRAGPRKEPDLKIIEVSIKPVPYSPQHGELEFGVTLDLPPEVESKALLEVTALISSPSRSSLRFLSYRNPIAPLLAATGRPRIKAVPASTLAQKGPSPRIRIKLTWDGKDHTKQEVSAGTYHYELRAKVIAGGDNTPRTLTVSWPKRGTLLVK